MVSDTVAKDDLATEIQKNLVIGNEAYAASFTQGDLALPPSKKYVVVTCMDARINPAAALNINLGDAHIIRNAGASTKDALRSIIISNQLLGTTEIIVIKHTGCGMLTFQNEDARGLVEKNLGPEAGKEVASLDFLPFPELDEAVKSDIAYLKANPAIAKNATLSGWVYQVENGRVRKVV